jgi:hypothetical protein
MKNTKLETINRLYGKKDATRFRAAMKKVDDLGLLMRIDLALDDFIESGKRSHLAKFEKLRREVLQTA